MHHAKKHAQALTQFFFDDKRQYLKTQLLSAAGKGDFTAVKAAVDAGADVNEIRNDGLSQAQLSAHYAGPLPIGTTALHILCARGELDGIKLLLEHGAKNFYAVGSCNRHIEGMPGNPLMAIHGTPLKVAMRAHQVEVVRLLDGDQSALNVELIKAAMFGDKQGAIKVIKQGADVNFSGVETYRDEGFLNSALFFACRYNHGDIATLLVEAGASCDSDLIKQVVYDDLLDEWRDVDFGVLFAAFGVDARNHQLLAAARSQNKEEMRDALIHGADPHYDFVGREDSNFGPLNAWQHCKGESYPDGEVWPEGLALLSNTYQQQQETEAGQALSMSSSSAFAAP